MDCIEEAETDKREIDLPDAPADINATDTKTETEQSIDIVEPKMECSAIKSEICGTAVAEQKPVEPQANEPINLDDVIIKSSEEENPTVDLPAHEEIAEESSVSKSLAENPQTEQQIGVKPTVQEPAIESISVKIEQIAIDKENVTVKTLETVKADVKPDFSMLDITPAELKRVCKFDVEKPKKELDVTSALVEVITEIGDPSIRRSGRIRTIAKTKQRAQGYGLVKDKKRAPVVVDEDSSSASFDVSTDNNFDKESTQPSAETKVRIKTEEELEKEKIDRENGMKLFIHIADNEYRSERTISKEAKKMTCDCFMTQFEIERGEMGCGDDCLNRMLLIECSPKCIVGDRCTNRRFQKHQNSPCNIFKTEKKGYGLIATSFIPAGVFIMEYVGEVLNSKQFEKRANDYSKLMNAHYYFMALSSDCVIDATKKGNISRFINHSCDPNAETQKWTVNGELRIGFFSKKPIMPDEEITFDYQFQRYG